MADHDLLSSLILDHWTLYRPSMLAQLRQENRLAAALHETGERFTDLMYDLMMVRKMAYHQAWEIAIAEYLTSESPTSRRKNPRATSASREPTASGWAARTKKRKRTSRPSGS